MERVNQVATNMTTQTGKCRKNTLHKSAVLTGPRRPMILYKIGIRIRRLEAENAIATPTGPYGKPAINDNIITQALSENAINVS